MRRKTEWVGRSPRTAAGPLTGLERDAGVPRGSGDPPSIRRQRGNTTLEMTLIGIPLIFILISIFEISRGMWNYHTVAYAAKEGVRYAIVHGQNCGAVGPIANTCLKKAQDIATVIKNAGVGLNPDQTKLTFKSAGNPDVNAVTLKNCVNGVGNCGNNWPVANAVGTIIEIDINTEFHSMASLFWPGAGKGISFAATKFYASSQDRVQF